MMRVDTALFANVVTSVQRTGNLPGGAVRGLPGGTAVEGLKGVDSFASAIADAKREYELGRVHNAASQIRQLETQFNSIAGRWNATVNTIISSARQGRQQLPSQKLTEVKNAQSKMRQLTSPATKTFRDLVTALEQAIAAGGSEEESDADPSVDPEPQTELESAPVSSAIEPAKPPSTPDINLLGNFADKYRFGPQLEMIKGEGKRAYLSPNFEAGKFYFLQGTQPPTVVRIREIRPKSVIVFDAASGGETQITTVELKRLVGDGIWLLVN